MTFTSIWTVPLLRALDQIPYAAWKVANRRGGNKGIREAMLTFSALVLV